MKRSWYLSTKRLGGLVLLAVAVVGLGMLAPGAAADSAAGTDANATAQSGMSCRGCHEYATPGIFEQYRHSEHDGAGVSCLDCHKASPGEPTAERHNGAVISPLVTPKDCGTCHPKQVTQFHQSMHDESIWYAASALAESRGLNASDSSSLGWNENVLTHNSAASAESGCLECHGTYLKVTNDRHPDAPEEDVTIKNYPNQGIARLNPDGSVGSCAACHPQHRFSLEQARKPASCRECHMGPDHPQYEIYEETKHSTMFEHNEEEFDLGVENLTTSDITAPTCAVCHMSGLGDSKSTHDVSARLYWELEPVYSYPTSKGYETGRKRFQIREAFAKRYRKKYDLPRGSLDSVPTGAPNPFAAAKSNVPELYDKYVGEGKWWDDVGDNGGATRWDSFGGKS
ncbi:MAG: multiheme c-type cytochrome, partial [Halodesulfurarchaeum sp.]